MELRIFQIIRDSLSLPGQALERRRESMSNFKTAQVASCALLFGSFGLAILNAYDKNFLTTLGFLSMSYAGLECKTVADNALAILKNPSTALHVATFGHLNSNKNLWKFVTQGAPIARKAGLYYLTLVNPEPSFFSKVRRRLGLDKGP
jgi:hypothetical protein